MTDGKPNAGEWLVGLIFIGLAVLVGHSLPHKSDMARFADNGDQPVAPAKAVQKAAPASGVEKGQPAAKTAFTPPDDSKIPDDDFGKMVKLGQAIFHDTQANAKEFVGNDLQCSNCHIDRGRLANSAPLWAAYVAYPAYRSKNDHVNTFQERLQGCFRYSLNGKAPPFNDKVLVALESYAYFLAQGLPTGDTKVAGRGYPALAKPANFDFQKGGDLSGEMCAMPRRRWRGPEGGRRQHRLSTALGAALVQLGRRHGLDQQCCGLHQGQHAADAGQFAERRGRVERGGLPRQPREAPGSALHGIGGGDS